MICDSTLALADGAAANLSTIPRPGDQPSPLDVLTLGAGWCHDLHTAGIDCYGRPLPGREPRVLVELDSLAGWLG